MATDVFYDRRRQWTRMLRSMGLKQVGGSLKAESPQGGIGFCCLGVGCELAVISGVIPEPVCKYSEGTWYYGADVHNQDSGFDESAGSLPPSVRDWLGFSEYGYVNSIDPDCVALAVSTLINMNDSQEASFAEIADYIDAWDEAEAKRRADYTLEEITKLLETDPWKESDIAWVPPDAPWSDS